MNLKMTEKKGTVRINGLMHERIQAGLSLENKMDLASFSTKTKGHKSMDCGNKESVSNGLARTK